jgi:chaperonin GroES
MDKLGYRPRGDRLVVKRLERTKPKEGDVFLPESQQKDLNSGIVIAVGPGSRNRVTGYVDAIEDIREGDRVDFVEYAGSEIDVNGEKYLVMREEEIYGVWPRTTQVSGSGWGSLGEPVEEERPNVEANCIR